MEPHVGCWWVLAARAPVGCRPRCLQCHRPSPRSRPRLVAQTVDVAQLDAETVAKPVRAMIWRWSLKHSPPMGGPAAAPAEWGHGKIVTPVRLNEILAERHRSTQMAADEATMKLGTIEPIALAFLLPGVAYAADPTLGTEDAAANAGPVRPRRRSA